MRSWRTVVRVPHQLGIDLSSRPLRSVKQGVEPVQIPDSAIWLEHRQPLVDYFKERPEPRKWDEWLAAEAPIRSWYRESLSQLRANPYGEVDGVSRPMRSSSDARSSPSTYSIEMKGVPSTSPIS